MRKLLAVSWLAIGVTWASAFLFLGRMAGGVEYISHMGWLRSATQNLVMSALCVGIGAVLILAKRCPRGIIIAAGLLATAHLVNAVSSYIAASANSLAAVSKPFVFFAVFVPTNSSFLGMPDGNLSYLLLPSFSLAICLVTLLFQSAQFSPLVATDGA